MKEKILHSVPVYLGCCLLLMVACGKGEAPASARGKADFPTAAPSTEAANQQAIAALPPVADKMTTAEAEQAAGTTEVNAQPPPQQHTVYAQATSFDPILVFINPGDTVQWTNMSPIHDSVSMEGLIPDGAKPWKFAIGENGSVTLDKEGVYIYKCIPHYAVGMAGAIIVGKPVNMEQIKENVKNVPGRARGIVIKVDRALKQRRSTTAN